MMKTKLRVENVSAGDPSSPFGPAGYDEEREGKKQKR